MADTAMERAAASRTRLADALTRLAAAHVLLPLSIVTVAVAGFALGRPMDAWVLPIAALLAFLALRAWSSSWRALRSTVALTICTHAAAGVLSIAVPDYSWDGLAYQQEAVLRLASGWNPLAGSSAAYGSPGEELWIDHYPKAPWIAEASVLLDTGRVEAGKLFNLTLIVAAAAIVTATLLSLTRLQIPVAALLGGLVALNPVAIYQSSTFYVDTLLASALTVLVAGLVLWAGSGRWQPLAVAFAAACLAINVKFTGVVYVVVLLALAVGLIGWLRGLRSGWRLALAAAAPVVIGVAMLGYAPYVSNFRDHGNPFYPVTPSGDVMNQQSRVPPNLQGSDRVTRFLISSVSRSEDLEMGQSTHPKLPWSVSAVEVRSIYVADIEAGGFGPLYGALLLLAGAGGLGLVARRRSRRAGAVVLLVGGSVLLSMFTHDQTWVARYVPQAWMLPLLIAIPSLCAARWSSQWWIGSGLVALAVVNLAVVGAGVGWRQLTYARTMHRSLVEMANAPQPITVYFERFRSLRQRLREAGIDFQPTEHPPDATVVRHEIPVPGHRTFWIESQHP